MAEQHAKWFDLGRFGAALRLIPRSPLRGVPMTCLEIRHTEVFELVHGLTEGLGREEREAVARRFQSALVEFGFNTVPERVVVPGADGEDERVVRRMFSTKTEFTLTELRRLIPGLEPSDLREMPVSEVVLEPETDPHFVGLWRTFAESVLANEAVKVWTPRVNPFDKPFSESATMAEVKSAKCDARNPLVGGNNVASYFGMAAQLDRANYRSNALIPYYADLGAATANGWSRGELVQVDLPYALPLWVTAKNEVIALRDVRHAPEVMHMEPGRYYPGEDKGLIVGLLREAPQVSEVVAREVERWEAWASAPGTLESAEAFWESVNTVVTTTEEFSDRHPRAITEGGWLLAGPQTAPERPYRARPLSEWAGQQVQALSRLVAAYVDRPAPAVEATIGRVEVAAKTLLEAQAAQLARRKLEELAATVQSDAPAEIGTVRHEDAGEKIGGARKDYARRALTVEDMEAMNAMERRALVVKKNVWPTLDYRRMREEGVEPEAALAIKYLKDVLPTAPQGRVDEPEVLEGYIEAIGTVRDRMATVKTLDDFKEGLRELYALGSAGQNDGRSKSVYGSSVLQRGWGSKACWLIYEGEDGRLPYKIANEIRRKVGRYGEDATDDQRWSPLIKHRREKSESELEEERKQAEQDRELHRPHLDRVVREGPDWRGGRDITADDLMEHFGFRAVEFGNWLPQDERQQVLNMAFDSFCDLAQAIELPPSEVSLGGELAVAFGSRGRGGRGAALAHYEPMRNVINLTRMKGAGVLAHEWWHALDWQLGGKRGYASEIEASRETPMGRLSRAMRQRHTLPEELAGFTGANVNKAQEYIASWCYHEPKDVRERIVEKLAEVRGRVEARFYERTVQHIENTKDNPRFKDAGIQERGVVGYEDFDTASAEFMKAISGLCTERKGLSKVKDKIVQNVDYLLRNMAVYVAVAACRDQGVEPPASLVGGSNSAHTGFYKHAKQLDTLRSSPYWATTRELFARAGAAYVQDKIEARAERSDYLVFGSDAATHEKHPVGNPNPTGRDREALATYFEALMTEYRLQCVKSVEVGLEP